MRICCIAFILIGAYVDICKAANSDSNLFLIPQPKRVEVWNGAYNFSKPYKISVVNTNDFYAKQLQETIEQKLSEKPSTALSPANKISLIRQDSSDLYNTLKGKQISL